MEEISWQQLGMDELRWDTIIEFKGLPRGDSQPTKEMSTSASRNRTPK